MTLFHPGPDPHPLRRILIANRGEIAVRIIRACRDEGIAAIAVHADCDQDALFVRMADEAYALGGDLPASTYLDADKIIAIACRAGADAIHPGYGFLSERADFARAVIAEGLRWIGPPPEAIQTLGDKIAARHIAVAVGAPRVAGSDGPVASAADALTFARNHGLPMAIKAAFGGGGRGLKVAWHLDEVEALFTAASREAMAAFGRGECFVEQFMDHPRHVEAQVLADSHGMVKVLGTRDCTLQRRNQKLVEESPAPFLNDDLRNQLHTSARAICVLAGYCGAATVEFLLSSDGHLSFLEVNTRLQVEHPVTEETTGIDIVRAMIRVAQGARLVDDLVPEPRGHSIEFRINAEDPARGFLPTPGLLTLWDAPSGPGVRMDSGVAAGSVVADGFDSLMAKLIVTGATRHEAIARARRALGEFRIEGLASTLPFARAVLSAPEFCANDGDFRVHTRWIEVDFAERLAAEVAVHPRVTPAVTPPVLRFAVEIDGRRHELAIPAGLLAGIASVPTTQDKPVAAANAIPAPAAGILQLWLADEDAHVDAGSAIAVIEAMKMEIRVETHISGRLVRLVDTGSRLLQDMPVARIITS